MTGPMDYSLCARTVTVYRKTESGLQRTVLPGCGYLHREEMAQYPLALQDHSLEKQNQEIMDSLYRLFDGE